MGDLAVKHLLESAVAQRIGSGMAASFGKLQDLAAGKPPCEIFVGRTSHLGSAHAIHSETSFDLASLTKIVATTTLAMKRYEQGRLDLNAPISAQSDFQKIKIRDLLTHASGIPAWKPIYESMRAQWGDTLYRVPISERERQFHAFLMKVLPEASPGQNVIYSDLGFMWLQKLLSQNFKLDIETLWASLGISGFHFRPVITSSLSARLYSELKSESIAATEDCPWRGLLVGQVHDDNAWSMGGISTHAGVFGRLQDLIQWIKCMFLSSHFQHSTVKLFTSESVNIDGTRRALGFDMPSLDGLGSTGFSFSKNTVGHLGYAGTSLWVDLVSGDYAILLTNRVHPSRTDNRIRALRREFHRLVRE